MTAAPPEGDEPPRPRGAGAYPVDVRVAAAIDGRNRLTTAFRLILAIPHLILVGGPMAIGLSGAASDDDATTSGSGGGGGLLGIAALVATVISWVALVVTARHPDTFRRFAAFYLRWRVRATAYLMLLRDEYPPFGDDPYLAELELETAPEPRNRLTVFFRILLAIPHLVVLWFVGVVWFFATFAGWVVILATGRFPPALHEFGTGVLRWTARVEAYMLLLRDEYPPFRLSP